MDRSFEYPTPFGTVPMTDPVQTGLDLARWHSLEDAVVALDHGLRQKWFTVEELGRVLNGFGQVWGIARLRQAVALATPWSESPRESELKILMWRAGLPPPYQQATIFDQNGKPISRLDFFFDEISLGVEYDGEGKYQGQFGDEPATVMRREMDQDRKLLNHGFSVIHVNRRGFRDRSGLNGIVNRYRNLNRHGPLPPELRWSSPGRAWQSS